MYVALFSGQSTLGTLTFPVFLWGAYKSLESLVREAGVQPEDKQNYWAFFGIARHFV